MSCRVLALFALVVGSSSLTACAEHVTAPQQPTLAPSTPRQDAFDPSSCKSGFILSEGRCA
jgi:hypothetical protein